MLICFLLLFYISLIALILHLIFSERELSSLFAVARPSVCRLLHLCALLRWLKFSAIFLWHLVPWPSVDSHIKFYGDRFRGTPPPGELNTRGVVKYIDFGPVESYVSEMVHERR